MIGDAENDVTSKNLDDVKVLGEFLNEIDQNQCTETTTKILEINKRLETEGTRLFETTNENSSFQEVDGILPGGFFSEIDESVQPNRDRGRGRLIAGPGAKIGGIQPRPAELRRTYCKTTLDMERKISNGRKYCMDMNLTFISARQREEQNRLRRDPLSNNNLRQQVISLMCRIYIGSINLDVKEETIRSIFSPYGIIRKVDLSWEADMDKHKGFAFVEYEVPDAAQLALISSNHHLINGRPMKVGRPSNMPQATPYIDMMLDEARKFPRLYVASVHTSITKEELKSVFEAFGPVVNIELPLNPGDKSHKGYAYVDFTDHKSAHDAMLALNRFDIGGQLIRVGPSVTFPVDSSRKTALPNATALAAAAVTAKIKSEGGLTDSVPGSENTAKSDMLSMFSNEVLKGVGIKAEEKTKQEVVHVPETTIKGSGSPETKFEEKDRKPSRRRSRSREHRKDDNDRRSTRRRRSRSLDTKFDDKGRKVARRRRSRSTENRHDDRDRRGSRRKRSGSSDTKFEPKKSKSGRTKSPHSVDKSPKREKNDSKRESSVDGYVGAEKRESLDVQKEEKNQILPEIITQIENLNVDGSVSIKGSEQRFAMMKKLAAKQLKNNVIVMRNMIEAEDIDDEVELDIRQECSKFGDVESILIHQSNPNSTEADNIIKVFVQYDSNDAAKVAREALDGRFFAGKIINVQLYDAMLYKYGDYSA